MRHATPLRIVQLPIACLGFDSPANALRLCLGILSIVCVAAAAGHVVAQQRSDDHSDRMDSSATRISLGSQVQGEIQQGGDRDVFRFSISQQVGATDVWLYTSGAVTNTVGELYDSGGNLVTSNNDSILADPETNFFVASNLEPGTYYIAVSGSGDFTGPYTLHSLRAPDQGDTNDVATDVTLGNYIDGIISNEGARAEGDLDLFRIVAQSQHFPRYMAFYTEGDVDTVAVLYNHDGVEIASNDDSDIPDENTNFLVGDLAFPGTYFLAVSGYGNSSGPYRLHASLIGDQGNLPGGASALELNGSDWGSLYASNDVDYFEIDLSTQANGVDVWLYTEGPTDTVGELFQGNTKLAANGDSIFSAGKTNFFLAENLSPGTYGLKVSSQRYSIGPYRVYARLAQDPGIDMASAGELSKGTPQIEVLSHGDGDLYKLDLSTEIGTVEFLVYTTGGLDTFGELLASDGITLLAQDADSGDGTNFAFRRELAPGVYYVRVLGQDGQQGGPYAVFAEPVTPIDLGGGASGTLVAGYDEQVYKLQIAATTDTWIYSQANSNTKRALDTVGKLLDSSFVEISNNDDSSLAGREKSFSIQARLNAGAYYLRVGGHGSSGGFTLRAESVPDQGGSVSTAQNLPMDSPAAGVIDTRGDVDYYRIDVDRDTHLLLYARTTSTAKMTGELQDVNGSPVESARSERGLPGFEIREPVGPGTYYLKVDLPYVVRASDFPVGYTVHAVEDREYTGLLTQCEAEVGGNANLPADDDLYGCQWSLKNRRAPGEDINVEPAWAAGMDGTGVNVVVVDNGLDYHHDDLSPNVDTTLNHDYTGKNDIYYFPANHGTSVAGIIAARDNSIGVRGVAPRATIYGHNYLAYSTHQNLADALTRNGTLTAVSNNSYGLLDGPGLGEAPLLWELAVEQGINEGYGGKGTFYANAAGNGAYLGDDANLDGTVNFYAVTAVCAISETGTRSGYSESGAPLWVCAPSGSFGPDHREIITTDNADRYREDFSGTSAATPFVSGVAALLRQANPDLTWRDLKLILAASARKNDPDHSGWEAGARKYLSKSSRGKYSFNHSYGFGVVDAHAALRLTEDWITVPPLNTAAAGHDSLDAEIPEYSSKQAMLESSVELSANMTFVEFVEIRASIAHPSFRQLQIELVSPSGTVSELLPPYATDEPIPLNGSLRLGSARHLGENPNGRWTLRVSDQITGHAGALESWTIKLYGHQSVPRAPVVTAVRAGDGTLVLDWREPGGGPGLDLTAYDLRYISTAADESVDANWNLVRRVWTPGEAEPSHRITGLQNGVEYDAQLRAINESGTGPWSAKVSAVPTANAQDSILVSNILQEQDHPHFQLDRNQHGIGQAFTTGSEQGAYILDSVVVHTKRGHESRFIDLAGAIYSVQADGSRGSKVADLTHSGSFPNYQPKAFTVSPGVLLLPDTSYMFVMECEAGCANDNYIQFGKTASYNEDPATLPGWSMANKAVKAGDGWAPSSNVSNSLLTAIQGHLANKPYIAEDGVTIVSVPIASPDTYLEGETITFSVAFNTAVNVDTTGGNPQLVAILGDPGNTPRHQGFDYVRGSGTNTLEFEYVVQSTDRDLNGIYLHSNHLRLQGGAINHATNGRGAYLEYPLPGPRGTFPRHKVNGGLGLPQATLTELALTGIDLSPKFDPGTTSYYATVYSAVVDVPTLTATPLAGATMAIFPADADATTAGHQIELNERVNEIEITVSKPGAAALTYTVVVEWIPIPPIPKNLMATAGDMQVSLSWNAPRVTANVSHHEYRYRELAEASYSRPWVAIADSAQGGTNEDGYTIQGLTNGITYELQIRAVNSGGASDPPAEVRTLVGSGLGSCSRTPAVRDGIIGAIANVSDCADVTAAQLSNITGPLIVEGSVTELDTRDFQGLSSLTELVIADNPQLTEIPFGMLEHLPSLEHLRLDSNGLERLPYEAFVSLSSLLTLQLNDNRIEELEREFDGLSSLTSLRLDGNQLPYLPEEIFSGLRSLTELRLNDNLLTQLPDGIFDGLTSMGTLHLQGNSVDPLVASVSLEVGTGLEFKAIVPVGAPFDIVLPINVTNGVLTGGATSVTIPAGATESAFVSVEWTPNAAGILSADIGAMPDIPGGHSGYLLSKSARNPLEMETRALAVTGIEIVSDPGQDDTYATGDVVEVAVTFNSAVTVDASGGIPTVEITVGNATRNASYDTAGGANLILTFSFTANAADSDQDGISVAANSLVLNGGSINDREGSLDAVLDHPPVPAQGRHRINKVPMIVPAGVSIVSSPLAAVETYGAGEIIDFSVTFDSEVLVDVTNGTPSLVVRIGDQDHPAKNAQLVYTGGSGNRTLLFSRTVLLSDRDSNGILVRKNQLRLNSGTIRHSTTGENANLRHQRPGQNGEFQAHKIDGGLTLSLIRLCGARLGQQQNSLDTSELDICWDLGNAIPSESDVVIEMRSIGFFDYPWGESEEWYEVARGDSYTQCPTVGTTCIRHTKGQLQPGVANVFQMRIRQADLVLATSPELAAHAPVGDAVALNANLGGVFLPDSFDSYANGVATGPFRMDLEFVNPVSSPLATEAVRGLEVQDLAVGNGTVNGITADSAGLYVITVTPATLGQPVTISLPANKVQGVGEGITSYGRNTFTRNNSESAARVIETAAPQAEP